MSGEGTTEIRGDNRMYYDMTVPKDTRELGKEETTKGKKSD